MTILPRRLMALVCVLSALMFSACGGGGGSSSSSDPAGSGDPPAGGGSADPGDSDPPVAGGPTDDGASANACFPQPLFTTGNKLEDSQRSTTSGNVTETHNEVAVMGSWTFNGAAVTRIVGSYNQPASGSSGQYTSYQSQGPGVSVLNHGQVGEASAGPGVPVSSTTLTYTPPMMDRYDLNPGGSYSQSFAVAFQSTQSGLTTETGQNVSRTITYVGRENVTVPGGTFTTCRFEQAITTTTVITIGDTLFPLPPVTSNVTVWYAVGSGFPVRRVEVSGGQTSTNEMLSFSINDVPVTGN